MPIIVLPQEILKRAAPKKLINKLVSQKLTVNRAAVSMLTQSGILSKSKLLETAIRVIKAYKEKFRDEIDGGATKSDAMDEALAGKALMTQRVQNLAITEIVEGVKKQYHGEYYEWLPSDADVPDPLHQLNYGKRFQIGKGEMPGDRYGCRCGMRILVGENRLNLED